MEEEKAKELALFLTVIHPASMPKLFDIDTDDFLYGFGMLEFANPNLVVVSMRQGISTFAAIEILQNMITKISLQGTVY